MADRAIFSEEHWEAYMRLNHAFAEETLKVLRTVLKDPERSNDEEPPIIWIHDYFEVEGSSDAFGRLLLF